MNDAVNAITERNRRLKGNGGGAASPQAGFAQIRRVAHKVPGQEGFAQQVPYGLSGTGLEGRLWDSLAVR